MDDREKRSRRRFLKTAALSVPGVGGLLTAASAGPSGGRETESRRRSIDCDLMVYGGTSAGVMAAYTARMYGLRVLLVAPGRHLGGLTSGGLGRTDTGNEGAITGLSKEFYIRIARYYGQDRPMYRFEPRVAEAMFERYVDEAGVEVLFSRRVTGVEVRDAAVTSIDLAYSADATRDLIRVRPAYAIDATYEGDLMALAGVSYVTGREGNGVYTERYNGVQPSSVIGPYGSATRDRDWAAFVDPYVVPGKPSSGLLPEIQGVGHEPAGTGDEKIQAYCFRLCLTQDRANQIPLETPDGYDPQRYELLARLLQAEPWESLRDGFIISEMPNGKTDWNNWGLVGFSSDHIGANWDYPDADYERRAEIWRDHVEYQRGLLWFLATDERVPAHLRDEMNSWGYCRDEFLDTDGWPHALYVREARRMVSDFVMTEHHCIGAQAVEDGIARGAYPLDSHSCQRVVVDDHVENEGLISVSGFDPYPISYRSIIPKRGEVNNLLVPVCVSASHSAFGSIRMEPVFMALGQAAGVATYLAAERDRTVHDVVVDAIQKELRENPLPNRSVPREYADVLPLII